MAPNRVQKRSTHTSNKNKVGDQTRAGRVTSTNPIQSPQAKIAAADQRAALAAEKAIRKAQKDKSDRLEKYEVVDISQHPSNSFIALSISSDKLRNLHYPIAERIWGIDYKPLGLSRDWTKRVSNPDSQIKYQPAQVERAEPGQQISSGLLRTTASSTYVAGGSIINDDPDPFSSQPVNLDSCRVQPVVAEYSEGISHSVSSRQVEYINASSPLKKKAAVFIPLKRLASKDQSFKNFTSHRLGDIIEEIPAVSGEERAPTFKFQYTDSYSSNGEMAPVKDPHSVQGALKDVVQNLFEVQTQVHGFVNETQPLLVDKMTELAHNLDHLQTVTSPIKSPDNPIHQTRIAPEIIDYVDDGRNPDIFTRDFVELVSRGNAVINGKQQAFRDFSRVFADALKKGFPGLTDEVDRIMKDAEEKNKGADNETNDEDGLKKEIQENGAGRS